MDNMSYRELINITMMDLREKLIQDDIKNDDEVETNVEIVDDFRSVAYSTYADMICK